MRVSRTVRNVLANYESDNPGTKSKLAGILMNGRLGGTGKLVIRTPGPAAESPNPDAWSEAPCRAARCATDR